MLALHLCVPVIAALASAFQVPAPRETGGVVRLAGHVKSFDVTSDGGRAVFLTDPATAGMQELCSVRTDGSHAPTRLNEDVFTWVFDYRISPDGSKVAFLGDREVQGSLQLFVAPSDGSAPPVELSGPLPAGGGVYTLQFSPDGSRLVYLARQDSAVNAELYSVLTDGSAPPVRLHGPLSGDVTFHVDRITPDGATVLYFAPIATDPFRALFAAPIDGSVAPVQVGVGDPSDLTSLQVARGSDFAAFKVFPPSSSLVTLYSVPIDGSSAPLPLGQHVLDFQITPDDARVVFRAGIPLPSLYSRPVGGGAAVELSETDGSSQLVAGRYQITPDGSRALYIADQRITHQYQLFSVPTAGGVSVRLSNSGVKGFLVDPTGARAVSIVMSGSPLPRYELFSVSVSGGSAVRISDPMVGGRGVAYQGGTIPGYQPTVAIHPLGDEVLYLADHDVDEVFELYRGPIDGSAPPQKVNGALVSGGDVQAGFRYGGDRQVLFRADASTDGDYELFATRSRVLRTQ